MQKDRKVIETLNYIIIGYIWDCIPLGYSCSMNNIRQWASREMLCDNCFVVLLGNIFVQETIKHINRVQNSLYLLPGSVPKDGKLRLHGGQKAYQSNSSIILTCMKQSSKTIQHNSHFPCFTCFRLRWPTDAEACTGCHKITTHPATRLPQLVFNLVLMSTSYICVTCLFRLAQHFPETYYM